VNETTTFDYSLQVNGDEQHYPVAPFMFATREDALAVAVRQAASVAAPGDVVIISTFASNPRGLAADPTSRVEHHHGQVPEEWLAGASDEQSEPAKNTRTAEGSDT
jgi:hypothetical protein